MRSMDRFQDTQLPPRNAFFSRLTGEVISIEDYAHAQRIWSVFRCRTMLDFHNIYLLLDILLLADVFEKFRRDSMALYGLEPVHYYSLPGLYYYHRSIWNEL